MKRLLMVALTGVAAGLVFIVVLIRGLENQFIYFPPRFPEGFPSPQVIGQSVEEIWLTTEDGLKLNAFFRANPTSRQALLWFHGNAENIGYGLDTMKVLSRLGVSLLAVDYRGYGKSEGKPDEAGLYHDADAAYDYLVAKQQIRPQDIFVYGVSLGGAVAIDLASRRRCGGLIVQSSFTSARAMARRMLRIPLLEYVAKSRFDSLAKIRTVQAPILIAHGTHDEAIPFAMGEQLFAAAPEPKRLCAIEGAGHNDVIAWGGERYLACLKNFLVESARE
jgi:fermentation-respiration switch protein FrsA (DUF1100 family)